MVRENELILLGILVASLTLISQRSKVLFRLAVVITLGLDLRHRPKSTFPTP